MENMLETEFDKTLSQVIANSYLYDKSIDINFEDSDSQQLISDFLSFIVKKHWKKEHNIEGIISQIIELSGGGYKSPKQRLQYKRKIGDFLATVKFRYLHSQRKIVLENPHKGIDHNSYSIDLNRLNS